jgi:hypothetical protein
VHPEVNASVDISGCKALWTLQVYEVKDENRQEYQFLVLSRTTSTIILQSRDEGTLQEVTNTTCFIVNEPTLNVATLQQQRRVLQITPSFIRLMDASRVLHETSAPPHTTFTASYVCDPYVMVALSDQTVWLLRLAEPESNSLISLTLSSQLEVTHFCLSLSLFECRDTHTNKQTNKQTSDYPFI